MSGRRDIEIVFTGLRPGEKLGEELFSAEEQRRATSHPLVSSVDTPSIAAGVVHHATHGSHLAAAEWMRKWSAPTRQTVSAAR
jgi:FlaA1/EpsC-like NDP-sugar epimerase